MARTPEPPNLQVKKTLPRFIIEVIVRAIVLTWLYAQAIGLIFYLIWHNSSVAFREFMFRDFITLWETYSRGIFPSWFFYIPTWKDPLPWLILAIALIAYIWSKRGFPDLRFKVGRYHSPQSNTSKPKPRFHSGQKNNDGAHDTSEDDFAFDQSAFASSKQQSVKADIKQIEHLGESERERRLKALADHPATPKNERKIAKQKLKKLGR